MILFLPAKLVLKNKIDAEKTSYYCKKKKKLVIICHQLQVFLIVFSTLTFQIIFTTKVHFLAGD